MENEISHKVEVKAKEKLHDVQLLPKQLKELEEPYYLVKDEILSL